jgi:predicted metal-binding membrane protein
MWSARDDRLSLALIGALIALAWLALAAGGQSPYGRYLHHGTLDGAGPRDGAALLAVMLVGWLVMTVAMMLPTSLPLLVLFSRMTARRPDGRRLVALLVVGYLAIWTLFGLAALLADLGLHALADGRATSLNDARWLLGAGTLALAGAYQFSALKYRCLDTCRTPLGFITTRWRGRDQRRGALALGARHGLFCLGCCWSLMLVMFVVGAGSLGWMLALGALMAVEKNLPWGRRFGRPLGVALLGCAGVLVLSAVLG